MRDSILSSLMVCVIVIISTTLSGCSEQHPPLGDWKTKTENHEYDALHLEGAPFPALNEMGWFRVKEIGTQPESVKPALKPYSVVVIESGFAFLQSTKTKSQELTYEDLQWGWKVVIENKSKRGVWAYGGYSLFDKDGFVLAAEGIDWDNDESGVLIKAGERGTVQGITVWRIPAATKPYPPSRVVRGDYKLFLRPELETVEVFIPLEKKR